VIEWPIRSFSGRLGIQPKQKNVLLRVVICAALHEGGVQSWAARD
jgi:hypothetical protein